MPRLNPITDASRETLRTSFDSVAALDLQDVYAEIGEATPADTVWHPPGELPDQADAIAASGCFVDIRVRQFDWEEPPEGPRVTFGGDTPPNVTRMANSGGPMPSAERAGVAVRQGVTS